MTDKSLLPRRTQRAQRNWKACVDCGRGQGAPETPTSSEVVPKLLPASGLQHVGFVQTSDGEAFHGASQIFADLK